MVQKKKKPDKLIAGFLALLTAFSPVASVVPVYASSADDGFGNSITMDPDSIQIDGEDDGIVIDSSGEDVSGITVVGDDNNGSDVGSDGIQIGDEEPGDGGIQFGDEEQPDDGIDIDTQQPDDGISIDQVDDGIVIDDSGITIDPWIGFDDTADYDELMESPEDFDVKGLVFELDVDIRSVHGFVELTPVDSVDLKDKRIVRVVYSEDDSEYVTVVKDGNGDDFYTGILNDIGGVAWSEFLDSGVEYIVKIVADDGYYLHNCVIVNSRGDDSSVVFESVESDDFSYSCQVIMNSDIDIVANFSNLDENLTVDTGNDANTNGDNDSDVVDSNGVLDELDSEFLYDDNEDSEFETGSVVLDSEVDQLGHEDVSVIGSMADDVKVPDSDLSEDNVVISDKLYEGYIFDNLDESVVDVDSDRFKFVSFLHTTQSLFDRDLMGDRSTIDDIMNSDDVDYVFILQNRNVVPVYDIGDDNYYVSFANTMHFNSKSYVFDHCFVYNNVYGEILSDCIYDYDTGLAYISKSYFENEDGVQLQLGHAIDYSNPDYVESAFLLHINDDDPYPVSFDMFRDYVSLFIDPGFDPSKLDIYVNDSLVGSDGFYYDSDTGELIINLSSSVISYLHVVDTRTTFNKFLNAVFPVMSVNAATPSTWQKNMEAVTGLNINGTVENGKVYEANAQYCYFGFSNYGPVASSDPSVQAVLKKAGYGDIIVSSGTAGADSILDAAVGGSFDENISSNEASYMDFALDPDSISFKSKSVPFVFDNISKEGSKKNKRLAILLGCSHNSAGSFLAGGATVIKGKHIAGTFGGKSMTLDFYKGAVAMRVVNHWKEGDKTYVVFAVGTQQVTTQRGAGLIKFVSEEQEPQDKYLRIKKKISSNYDVAVFEELGCYSFSDTWFGLYSDEKSAENAGIKNSSGLSLKDLDDVNENNLEKILKTKDEDGYTGYFKVTKNGKLLYDELYVVETKAGNGYRVPLKDISHRVTKIDLKDLFPDVEPASGSRSFSMDDVSNDLFFYDDISIEPLAASDVLSRADSSSTGYIIVGDSRTVGYYEGGGISTKDIGITDAKQVTNSDYKNTFIVAKTSQGLSWLKETGIKSVEKIKKSNPDITKWVVVFSLGVNDCSPATTANSYAAFYKSIKSDFDKIYVTPGLPVNDDKASSSGYLVTDKMVKDFNAVLKSAIAGINSAKVSYLNIYNEVVKLPIKYQNDGVHYGGDTYKSIFSLIFDKIKDNTTMSSGGNDDNSTGGSEYKGYTIDGNKATISYSNAPVRDPGDLLLFKTGSVSEDIDCAKDLNIPKEMNGAQFKVEYWAEYDFSYDETESAWNDFCNFARDVVKDDPTNTVVMETGQYEIQCRHSDSSFHYVESNGVMSLNQLDSIVSGEWPYRFIAPNATGDKVCSFLPLGIYRITEVKAPNDYELPDNVSQLAGVVTRYRASDDKMMGQFRWIDGDNAVDLKFNHKTKSVGNLPNYAWPNAPSYVDLGIIKIDKDTGKPGKPVNDVLSLEGIKFGVYHDDDCVCGGTIKNPMDSGAEVDCGEKFENVELVTDENGCADTVGLNGDDGVLMPGHNYYLKELEPNDAYMLNETPIPFMIDNNCESKLVFPTKAADKKAIGWEDVKKAKDLLDSKNTEKLSKVLWIENSSPHIGVGVQKFDIMRNSSEYGSNGKAHHGNATLEGHTYVVLNGTKTEIRLNDKKMSDGKGTKVKSVWEHGDHLKNPYNPTYKELYHYAEESDFEVDPDGNGYICAVLTTNKDGYAETLKDLLPLGVYWVIEVKTKAVDEYGNNIDYLVNDLDVGHVGEYEPGGDGVDEEGNPKDKYSLTSADTPDGKPASEISEDGEVFKAAFTQLLKDTEWKDEEKSHSDAQESADVPPRGGVEFQKYNYNSDDPYATGDSDLSGFEFTIINVSEDVVKNKDGKEVPSWKYHGYIGKDQFTSLKYNQVRAVADTYGVQKVVTELVDDPDPKGNHGKVNMGRTGNQDLPFGDYLIIETGTPEKSGYKLNTSWVGYFEIRKDKEIVQIQSVTGDDHNMDAERWRGYNGLPMKYAKDAVACRNKPVSMGIAIEKLDYEMKKPIAQGVASLKGAMYAVINASDQKIATKDGRQVPTIQDLSDYSNDAVSFKYLYDIYRNDTRYSNTGGHVVTTFTTDKRGFASTDRDALPAGTYYVIEVKASPGYWIDENFVGKVCVRDDDICMAMTDKNNPTANGSYFVNVNYVHGYDGENTVDGGGYQSTNENSYVYEPVQRCDLWFRKIDEKGKPKANIPFLISYVAVNNEGDDGTSGFETVLESHVIVSDSNGVVSTAGADAKVTEGSSTFTYPGRDRTIDVNGLDKYVENNTITREGQMILNSGVAQKMSVYFQGNSSSYPKDGELKNWGALYPGYYRITELQCEDNKNNYENLRFSKRIYIENTSGGIGSDLSASWTELMSERDKLNNQVKTIPTIMDKQVVVTSDFTEADSGTKTVACGDSVRVKDTVRLKGVEADTKYKLCVQFRDLTDGGKPLKITGTEGEFNKVSEDRLWVEHEFTPWLERGSDDTFVPEEVYATINTKGLNGHTIIAVDFLYEWVDETTLDYVDGDWILIKMHPADVNGNIIEDESQMIYVPDLHTNASDKFSGDRTGSKRRDDVILDTVYYEGLTSGVSYGIWMDVVDSVTGKSLTGKTVGIDTPTGIISVNGTQAGKPFSGTVNMKEYEIDSSHFENQSGVVVEKLYRVNPTTGEPIGDPILEHKSLLDEDQTIRWPDIHTTASDKNTKCDVGTNEKVATIYDKVDLSNLVFDSDDHRDGYTYYLRGKLVYQKDFVDANGIERKAGDEIEMLDGTMNVVKITCDPDGNLKADHMEFVDVDDYDDDGEFQYDTDVKAKASITHKRWGYNVANKVHPEHEADNRYIEDHTCAIVDMSVELKFKLNSMDLQGGTAVAFEYLYHDSEGGVNNEVANHTDLLDESQSIHYSKVETSAVDNKTGDSVGTVGHKMTVVDTVTLTNLVIGREYKVTGTLMDQETGEEFLVNGQKQVQHAFVKVNRYGELEVNGATNAKVTDLDKEHHLVSGTIDITFEFDSTAVEGKTLVVFEDLYYQSIKIACHNDIHDKSQTVYIPKIRTTNTDGYTKDHVGTVTDHDLYEEAVINDEVKYWNLVIGKEYTINGVLMNRDTGEPLLDADKQEIRASHTFVAGDENDIVRVDKRDEDKGLVNGSVIITFKFDGRLMENITAVAFEDLVHNGIIVTTHSYLEDEEQTIHFPKIRTSAMDKNTVDEVGVVGKTTLTDSVQFWNLIPGETYTVIGTLMDKATGEPILVNGKKVTASDFVRIRPDGTVDHDNCITCDCGCNVVNGKPCTCDHVPVTVLNFDRDNNRVSGWIDINFEFDASSLEGKDIVVFEEMYHNGIKVCEHKDINDLGQTVHFPKIRTSAIDRDTGDQAGTLEENVQVVDTVKYWNLVIGKEYTVKGILMNQETGEPIINSDGKYVEAEATFEITRESYTDNKVLVVHEEDLSVDGEFTLRFDFDSRQLPDESVVVFEDLYHNEVKVTTHSDLRDHAQTVHYPSIHTTAVDENTGSHVGSIYGSWIDAIRKLFGEKDLDGNDIPDDKQQNIIDTVTLTNLVPGHTYAVAGKLYNVSESLKKQKNIPLLIDGKEITQYAVITVAEDGKSIISKNGEKTTVIKYNEELDRVDGTVDLTYSLDSSRIQGVEIVVFEDLYQDVTYTPDGVITLDEKDIIARHEDINDKQQSISEVRMHTVAKSTSTADDVGVVPGVSETVTTDTIRDEISLEKLVPNESYTIKGVLVNIDASDFANGIVKYLKEDGTLTENREEAYQEQMSFTAHEPDETHYMDFRITSEKVAGMRLTVFEELWYYWTCETGEYHEAKVSMHPQSPYGWDYSWSTDAILQTVYYPEIHTNAIDVDTGDNVGTNADQSVVVDKVSYSNLVIGREYTLRGTLMNQDSGMPILDTDGTALTQEVTFTAVAEEDEDNPDNHITEVNTVSGTVSGEYTIRFVLDTRILAGQSAVAFEELYHNGLRVCVHTDLFDHAQTVHYPEIHTTARDSETNDHVGSIWGALINSARRFFGEKDVDGNGIPDDKEQVILDKVTLENLVPGKTYIVTGKLYDKNESVKADTILPLFIDGKEITNAVTITVSEDGTKITASDGSEAGVDYYSEEKDRVTGFVEMKFVFDGSKVDGKHIVVFEKLYHDSTYDENTSPENSKEEDLIHKHENIDDEDQTVSNVKIRTIAVDGETKDHVGLVSDKKEYSAIVDTVSLSGLVPGMTYKIKGFLVDMKASDFEREKPMYYKADGSTTEHMEDAVSDTIEFTALKTEETHQLEFAVKSDKVAGKSITVFENLYHNDVIISMHPSHDGTEWNDQAIADQSVHYPLGKTNATDTVTGTHTSIATEKRIIVDRVYFENLLFGEEYAIRGTLCYQEDFVDVDGVKHKAGEPVDGVGPTTVKLIPQPGLTEGYYDDGSGKAAPVTDFETTTYVDGQKAGSGYIDLEFEVDASKLAGAKIVAFETFYYRNVEVFVHADITDKAQTITIPKISTSAKSLELDEASVRNEDGSYRDIEIVDTVTYENLWSVADLDAMADAGEYIKYDDGTYRSQDNKIFSISENATYIVRGILMNKVTGEPLKNIKGETYVAESEPFVAYEPNGTVDVVFTVNVGDLVDEDRDTLESKSLVVFEDLYQAESSEEIDESEDEKHIGIHHDIDDEEQDIRFPRIRTHAVDGDKGNSVGYHPSESATGVHEVLASENMTITDTVSFENLHWGKKYTITGTLQVVTEFDSDGTPIKWEAAKDKDGKVITMSKEFDTRDYEHVGDSVSGTVDLVFKFDGLHLAGKTIVVFEKLERDDVLLGIHADITDEPQTVFVPKIHTNASDLMTGLNEMMGSKKSVVLDEVSYENLEAGKTYILKAALHRKSDGSTIPGAQMTGTFIAGLENQYILPDGTHIGSIEEIRELIKPQLENLPDHTEIDLDGKVEYTVGQEIQAGYYKITPGTDSGFGYWAIYYNEDGSVPTERTAETTLSNGVVSAGNMADYIKVEDGMVLQLATWCDTQYEQVTEDEVGDNLDTTLFLYYQARDLALEEAEKNPDNDDEHEGMTLRGDGKRVSGSVFVVIPVDTSQIAGDAVVAFEQLWVPLDKGEKIIAIHEDLEDEDQTVHVPKISTSATIDGDKTAVVTDNMTVVDTVTYEGLTPGREYILSGELMDKETGFSTDVTSTMTFTPETPNGSVELEFRFDGTKLVGKQLVVFETLSRDDGHGNIIVVAEHKDIEDAAQTVSIQSPPIDIENPIPNVDAGDVALWMYGVGFAVVLLLLIVLLVMLRKAKKSDDDSEE